jgi:hypothetical protein
MTKLELAGVLALVLLLGGVTLWGVTTLIDHYAFADVDDPVEVTTHRR